MSGDDMAPLERLLNLVGLLLDSDRPVTFDQIRETLDAYGGENVDSAKRKFERDKDLLREYGVPLVMADTDVWGVEQGYLIPKDQYYLPEITFTPEEVTALFVAAQGAREETAVVQGLRKLLYGSDGGVLLASPGGPLVAGSDSPGAHVMAAAEASSARRRIGFTYRNAQGATSERTVDAYAVVFRGGRWYLIGLDQDREEIRAFRLSRCASELNDAGEGSEPPAGFSAKDHVQAGPWEPAGEDRASVAFAPDAAILAEGEIAGAMRGEAAVDGRPVLEIPFSDETALTRVLVQYGPAAEVLAPEHLRVAVIAHLEQVRDA